MAATDLTTEQQVDALALAVKGDTNAIKTLQGTGTLSTTAQTVIAAINETLGVAQAAAGGGTSINDAATNTTEAWSSQKVTDYTTAAVNAVVDGAPGAIDTLNELAAAIGDDANFAATVTTALGNRLRFDATQTLTAPQRTQALTNLGVARSTVDFAAVYNA